MRKILPLLSFLFILNSFNFALSKGGSGVSESGVSKDTSCTPRYSIGENGREVPNQEYIDCCTKMGEKIKRTCGTKQDLGVNNQPRHGCPNLFTLVDGCCCL